MKANRHAGNILLLTLWIVMVWVAVDVRGTEMAAPLAAAAQSSEQLQIEKGRTAVTQLCVGCHGGIQRMLEIRKRSEDEWRDTIYAMIGRGAQVLPDEIEPLVAYLVASAGAGRQQPPSATSPATATTNQGLPGTGEADAILAQRCLQCHDIERAITRSTPDDWETVIDRMVTLGASVTPAERQTLLEYLNGLEQ